jgi:hypothetical protein
VSEVAPSDACDLPFLPVQAQSKVAITKNKTVFFILLVENLFWLQNY